VKLVKRVRSLEEKSRVKAGPQDAGIVWTSYEARIDPASLGDGEFLAADITIVESVGMWSRWRIKQRVSLDPSDRGIVYDAAGVRLGRVVDPEFGARGNQTHWIRDSAAGSR
jgi:hypothetical protein